jgi:beta-ureidopropionase / N-carbamoyl-L-amino-acid hydrolase
MPSRRHDGGASARSDALREIGTYKTGVHRPTLSPDDVISRQWLVQRMTEANLDAQIDGIANVFGRSRAHGRIILAGSHIESQNHAGWLDGALGVIYALEAARALRDDPATRDVGVDVIAFCDEESAAISAAARSSVTSAKPRSTRRATALTAI